MKVGSVVSKKVKVRSMLVFSARRGDEMLVVMFWWVESAMGWVRGSCSSGSVVSAVGGAGLGRGLRVVVSLWGRRGGVGLSSVVAVIVDGGRSCGGLKE